MTLSLLFPIAIGGAFGAAARAMLSGLIMRQMGASFPYGTLSVNIIGSLIIGLLAGWLLREGTEVRPALHAFLITGFLGGFTTFSAFSLETITMLHRGDTLSALLNMGLSVLLTVAACALGLYLIKSIA